MKTLENIFEVGLASVEEAKEMIIANGYDQKTVEDWLRETDVELRKTEKELNEKYIFSHVEHDEAERIKAFKDVNIKCLDHKYVCDACREIFNSNISQSFMVEVSAKTALTLLNDGTWTR
jgi:hemerythrin superfamily protein